MVKKFGFKNIINLSLCYKVGDGEFEYIGENPLILEYMELYNLSKNDLYKIENHEWYVNFIKHFPVCKYKTPKRLSRDYDWGLLCQLIMGCEVVKAAFVPEIGHRQGENELCIYMHENEIKQEWKISDLTAKKLKILYHILVNYQISYSHLSKIRNFDLTTDRNEVLKSWTNVLLLR